MNTDVSAHGAADARTVGAIDMKLEVITVPVSDVERAKRFYEGLGWRLDADIARGENFRVVQLTPPHSECSISLGKGLDAVFGTGAMEPGSQKRIELVVSDIAAAREDLISRDVEVSELFHVDGGRVPGRDPEGASYMTYASFSDPDGNTWLLQEVTGRLPGRVWDA
jgi:catechol 2,3-dioxygenase-like lactoylglutathione lyase family enzyme